MEQIIIQNRDGDIVSDDNQYSSYSFDSQYNVASDAFSVTLVDNDADILPGYVIMFLINNTIAYRGIIQRKEKSWSKAGRSVVLSGKDNASFLVESHCNNFKDFYQKTPVFIIDSLISQTNFNTKEKGSVDESDDSTGFNSTSDIGSRNSALLADTNNSDTHDTSANVTTYDSEFSLLSAIKHFKIGVGDKVYERINDLVKSMGYEILYENSGNLYIGDLSRKRNADPIIYDIKRKKGLSSSNVLEGVEIDDISGRHSTYSISAQIDKQYWTGSEFANINVEKIATDSTLPYKKFYSEQINSHEGSPEKYAIRVREDARMAGYSVNYTVEGHIDNRGEPWEINRLVNVHDDILKIFSPLVLYGREFNFDSVSGKKTILRLGLERNNSLEI